LRYCCPFKAIETITLAGTFEGGDVILIYPSVKLVTFVILRVTAPYLTVTLQAASCLNPNPLRALKVPPLMCPRFGSIELITGSR